MGFKRAGWPPDPVVVKAVDEGTWSERNGLAVGDTITAVNGRDISSLDKEGLKQQLVQRPLELTLTRNHHGHTSPVVPAPPSETKEADSRASVKQQRGQSTRLTVVAKEDDADLGFRRSGWPPDQVFVTAVDPGSLSARKGVMPGDTLVAVDGVEITSMTKAELKAAVVGRPLRLEFSREGLSDGQAAAGEAPGAPGRGPVDAAPGPQAAQELPEDAFALHVSEDDGKRLGFIPQELPKGADCVGPVYIELVEPGTWAERNGVARGDRLVAVNGEDVESLGEKQLKRLMRGRPLELIFSRSPTSEQEEEGEESEEEEGEGSGQESEASHDQPSSKARSSMESQRRPSEEATRQGRKLEFTAYDGENDLGLDIDLPPKPCAVKKLTPSGWAQVAGIKVGLILVSVNDKPCAELSKEKLIRAMKARPLTLLFKKPGKKKEEEPNGLLGFMRAAGKFMT